MKNSLLYIFFLLVAFSTRAQENGLFVKKVSKGLVLEHTVAAKEGLFSIGRLYNVHPRHLAAFNNIDYNKGLSIGQNLQIPLTDTNFNQQLERGTPVYYEVAKGETLFRISQLSNKLTADKIRSWNGLKGNEIEVGQHLIVGFFISDEMAVRNPGVPEKKEIVSVNNQPVDEGKPPVEEKPQVPEKPRTEIIEKPVSVPANTNQREGSMGYFKAFFEQQIRKLPIANDRTVTSGIFKTLSGWQDGKYYLLIDGVTPGTLVRITNPENGKVIYAKVLGEMAGIKLNAGLDIRISNAASSVLEIPEANNDKFIVKLEY